MAVPKGKKAKNGEIRSKAAYLRLWSVRVECSTTRRIWV